MSAQRADVVIVGAGLVGLAVARALLTDAPRLRLVVLEQEERIAAHQSSHNSGVVHAGIYYEPGSLKARLCVSGAQRLYEYCERHDIPYNRCGKVIVATSAEEIPALRELECRGRANGVQGLRRVSGGELSELEPHVRAVEGLHSPATGIVDFGAVAERLSADVRELGGTILTGARVTAVGERGRELLVEHAQGTLVAKSMVACAGAWSDRVAVAAGADPDPRIVPFRGAYLRLRPERRSLVRSLIYPVPDPALPFLGVHLTRHIDGDVLVGPTALLAAARDGYRVRDVRLRDALQTLAWPGSARMARRFWRVGLSELYFALRSAAFVHQAQRLLPALQPEDVLPGPAGVRAQAVGRDGRLIDDFVISHTPRALHVRNAPSPAATSALALGDLIAGESRKHLDL